MNESMAKSNTKPPQPQPQGIKSKTPSLNDMMKKRNTQGGFIDPVKMASDVKRFLKTMPEYGLLQDLKALRELYDFKVLPKGEVDKNSFMRDVRTQLEKHGVDAFNMSDLALARFADAVLIEADKVPKVKTTAKTPTPTDALMSEAPKYKSAEEITQASFVPVSKVQDMIKSGEIRAKTPKEISIINNKLDARIASLEKEVSKYEKTLSEQTNLNEKMTKLGRGDEIKLNNINSWKDAIVESKQKLKVAQYTKSQLTDIWNKANKK
jgi:hypothetical protein